MRVERGPGTVVLDVVPRPPRPHGDEPEWRLRDVSAGRDDETWNELLATLTEGRSIVRDAGVAPPPLIVVRAHLEERLTEPFDGGFMVSERAFHLLPWERFVKFHRIALWRTELDVLLLR